METTEMEIKNEEKGISSRRSAMLLGGTALAGMLFARRAQAQATATDIDILNFALNLEFLEAQFYTLATTGKTLQQIGIPTTGGNGQASGTVTVKANPMVPFTTPLLQQFAQELATEEQNHVLFLQAALGTSAVAMPNIDLLNSFNALSAAAGLGATFDPFASEDNFLLGSFIFEDVGVTAYQGAAPLITSLTYLDKASGIQAVEAYHAGSIRTRIYGAGVTLQGASQSIAALRAKLDGTGTGAIGSGDDIGVGTTASGAATIVDNDANALTYARSTTQVLSIVYGGGAAGVGGGFFPNAMNGTIV